MPADNSASDMASRTIYYFLFVAVIVFSARNPKHFYAFFRIFQPWRWRHQKPFQAKINLLWKWSFFVLRLHWKVNKQIPLKYTSDMLGWHISFYNLDLREKWKYNHNQNQNSSLESF